MRARGQRLQRGKVDLNDLVVHGVRVGGQRHIILFAPLRLQKGMGDFVAWKNGGCRAQLRAHIGDGGALGYRQVFHALAAVFHDLAHTALYAHHTQHLKDDVLGAHHGAQRAGKLYQRRFWIGDIIRAAAHGHGHVQTARTHGKAADAARRRRVAVGADERFAGFGEAFQMHLMADAVARAGVAHADLFGDGADETVVVGVHKAALQRVVVDISDGKLRAHTGDPHGLIFQICHGARGVLCECLVDAQAHLAARLHFAVNEVCGDDLLCDGLSHSKTPLQFSCAAARRAGAYAQYGYILIYNTCLISYCQ